MPTGPATGGASVGSLGDRVDEVAEAAEDQAERVDGRAAPRSATRVDGSWLTCRRRSTLAAGLMPSAPCCGVDRRRIAERHGERRPGAAPSACAMPSDDGLCRRARAGRRQRVAVAEVVVVLRRRRLTIASPDHEPGRRGRRVGLRPRRTVTPIAGIADASAIAVKIGERQQEVHRHAGDQDHHCFGDGAGRRTSAGRRRRRPRLRAGRTRRSAAS